MFAKIETPATRTIPTSANEVTKIVPFEQDTQAELRRKMYERIAQGNALAEVESNARRKR